MHWNYWSSISTSVMPEDTPYLPALQMADYNYDLPESRIALYPVHPKDTSRLFVYRDRTPSHHVFNQLPELLNSGDLLVLNNTKVIPARLIFTTPGGSRIEILLLKSLSTDLSVWEVMVGNRRKFKETDLLKGPEVFDGQRSAHLQVSWINRDKNEVMLEGVGNLSIHELIDLQGKMPLPPYIKREAVEDDRKDYQTVFARSEGAVAAPTASLHFTENVLDSLKKNGIQQQYLTLHVGMGTFKPVTAVKSNEHAMHAERFQIDKDLLTAIGNSSGRIIAGGTTATRVLESLYYIGASKLLGDATPQNVVSNAGFDPRFQEISFAEAWKSLHDLVDLHGGILSGETSIYIMPGFKFKIIDGLITNFHQPGSTLLLLVAALIGEGWKEIYSEALAKDYRFLSYGDGSLLLP